MQTEWGKTTVAGVERKSHTKAIALMLSVMWLAIGIVIFQIVRINSHNQDNVVANTVKPSTIDTTPPTDAQGFGHINNADKWNTFSLPLEIEYPPNNGTVTENKVMLVGRTRPMATVSVNGKTKQADTNGEFSQIVSLKPGSNTITIQARDEASRSAEKKVVVTYTGK